MCAGDASFGLECRAMGYQSAIGGKGVKARTHAAINRLVVDKLSNRAAGLGVVKLVRGQLTDVERGEERNKPDNRNLCIALSVLSASLSHRQVKISGWNGGCLCISYIVHTEYKDRLELLSTMDAMVFFVKYELIEFEFGEGGGDTSKYVE